MGKIRVHELAKELDKSSGDVINVLSSLGMTDIKAASGIDESIASKVRAKLGGPRKNTHGQDAAPSAQKDAPGKAQRSEEGAPKKKKFVAVFRRENARSGVISRMPTKQAQQRSSAPVAHTARPARRRPADGAGRPVDANVHAANHPDVKGVPAPETQNRPSAEPAAAVTASQAASSAMSEGKTVSAVPQKETEGKVSVAQVQGTGAKSSVDTGNISSSKSAEAASASQAGEKKASVPQASEKQASDQMPNAKSSSGAQSGSKTSSGSGSQQAKTSGGGRPESSRRDGNSNSSSRSSGQSGSRKQGQQGQFSGSKRSGQGDRGQRQDGRGQESRSQDGRKNFQSDRQRNGQSSLRQQQGGSFGQRGSAQSAAGSMGNPAKPGAPASRGSQGRNNSSSKGKYDQNRENNPSRGKNAGGRREGKDRSEKYNRFDENERVQTGRRRKDSNKANTAVKVEPVKVEEKIKTIVLPDHITLKELADKMKVQASQIIKKLFMDGKMVTMNSDLTYEEAEEIAVEYEILCEHEEKRDLIADLLKEDDENEDNMVPRPPVVCVMGHVDHGKTSLLDAIRDTHVTDRESGGITQHIGASVIHYNDRTITFLDTPGHEAFTAMRMRGANSTDIAVLVVAADDGVMPQTVEAINHAKAAGIEIIVAINKIDKPSANIDRVKQELTEYELIAEDWGGSTTMVPVSAKSHEGIDELLEMILLTADVMELKSNPNRRARGLVIEAKLDKGRGPVASLLIQKGTLHVGDPIDAGACFGKVRAMTDDKGRRVKEAGPSMPVEVIGFSDVPGAGEIFTSPETEKEAKNFAATFITVGKEKMIEDSRKRTSLDDLFNQIKEGTLKDLNLIVKADVQGSVEALRQSLLKLTNEEVIVKIIHSAVGAINESDVTLASASNAIIIGFNVRPDAQAKSTAEHEGVDIRLYKVIYDAINDVENAMKGMLEPVYEEKITGHAEIRQIFKASGVGNIAGSYVLDGTIQRGSKARITRDGKQIFEGSIASLKRFKDDVKEVRSGFECGLVFDGFSEIREGDQVEAYIMIEVPRT